MQIEKIKIYDDGENLRLTFNWPQNISQVYILAFSEPPGELSLSEAAHQGKLFTLQEYKKQAGYHTPKLSGEITYYIYPTTREDGEDIIYPPAEAGYTNKTVINFSLTEKIGMHKNYHLTISASHPVPSDTIYYAKGDTVYTIGEEISAPTTRIIRTAKDEYIHVFLRDEKLYKLEGETHGTV